MKKAHPKKPTRKPRVLCLDVVVHFCSQTVARSLEIIFGSPRDKTESPKTMIEQAITTEQEIDFTLSPRTLKGKPAKIDPKNPPTCEVTSGDSTFEPTDDPLVFTLRSAEDPGDTDFLVSADADLGEGVETISEVIRLTVTSPKATNLGIKLGEPREKAVA